MCARSAFSQNAYVQVCCYVMEGIQMEGASKVSPPACHYYKWIQDKPHMKQCVNFHAAGFSFDHKKIFIIIIT